MRLDAIEFLIEICIAASVLNVVLIIILFFDGIRQNCLCQFRKNGRNGLQTGRYFRLNNSR